MLHLIIDNTKKGFVPNKTYQFNPPVLTNCMPIGSKGGWIQKMFAEGWCIKFENGTGVFQGKPLGENRSHYFKVDYGSGESVASKK